MAALLPACDPPRSDGQPDVVLVSVDTLRADAISPYGGPIPTPTFERLAREGVVFAQAYASAPETAPSHATLFTGQQVRRHGVFQNGISLSDASDTLAEAFRAAGYATAAFVSSYVLDPRFAWGRGFETYDATFPEEGSTMRKERRYPGAIWVDESFDGLDRRGMATVRSVERWLQTAPHPFFLFVHFFDPHGPYEPPEEYLARLAHHRFDTSDRSVPGRTDRQLEAIVRRYHAEVGYADAALARLLEAVETSSAAAPLVVVTADHGEGLGSHGHLEHSLHLYEEQLHVPLFFHWPGHTAPGRRIETPVGIVDIAPTLTDLLDLDPLASVDGISLASAVLRGEEPQTRPIFGDRRSFPIGFPPPLGSQITVRIGDWRYIRRQGARDELYDLEHDPQERSNLVLEEQQVTNALAKTVLDYAADMPASEATPELTEAEIQNLRAMGYVE